MRGRWLAAAVLALAAVVGCTDDDGDTTGTTEPGAEFEEVTLERTGGIDGISEGVRIEADGTVLLSEFLPDEPYAATGEVLSDDELAELRELVTADDFLALEADYREPGECCDQFDYEVTAEVDGQTVTSVYSDFTEDVPEALTAVVIFLSDYFPQG